MGGCQNYGPFLSTLNIRCRIIIGTQKGTTMLTTTHMGVYVDNGKEDGSYYLGPNRVCIYIYIQV